MKPGPPPDPVMNGDLTAEDDNLYDIESAPNVLEADTDSGLSGRVTMISHLGGNTSWCRRSRTLSS